MPAERVLRSGAALICVLLYAISAQWTRTGAAETNPLARVQATLTARGYCQCVASGVFDSATGEAIRLFQIDNDLDATGRLDTVTLREIMDSDFVVEPGEVSSQDLDSALRLVTDRLDALGNSSTIAPSSPSSQPNVPAPTPTRAQIAVDVDGDWFNFDQPFDVVCGNSAEGARHGIATDQYYLGLCLWTGEGATRDRPTALRWFRSAADLGLPAAIDMVRRIEQALAAQESESGGS